SARETLKEIVGDPKTLAEEKATASLALVNMYDSIGPHELQTLIRSHRAGLRQMAAELVAHLDLTEYTPELISLLQDTSPDVRLQALYSLGLLKVEFKKEALLPLLEDSSPHVAITAAWLATVKNWPEGLVHLTKWL